MQESEHSKLNRRALDNAKENGVSSHCRHLVQIPNIPSDKVSPHCM